MCKSEEVHLRRFDPHQYHMAGIPPRLLRKDPVKDVGMGPRAQQLKIVQIGGSRPAEFVLAS